MVAEVAGHLAFFLKRGIDSQLFVQGNFLPSLPLIRASLLCFKVRDRNFEPKRSELCKDHGGKDTSFVPSSTPALFHEPMSNGPHSSTKPNVAE